MKTIIAIMGKAGAGKTAILEALCAEYPEYHKIVSCTTRPMRDNEKEEEDYHFLSTSQFIEKIMNGDMLEATEFNGWHYGTMKSSLIEGINIGVFNPEGYDCLTQIPMKDVKIIGIYIRCNDKERLIRQLNREFEPNVKEIIRRYQTDEDDFIALDNKQLPQVIEFYNETPIQIDSVVMAIHNYIALYGQKY